MAQSIILVPKTCFEKTFGFIHIKLCVTITVVDNNYQVEVELGSFRQGIVIPFDAARVSFNLGSVRVTLEFRPDTTTSTQRTVFLDGIVALPVVGKVRVFAIKLTLGRPAVATNVALLAGEHPALTFSDAHPSGYYAFFEDVHFSHAASDLREVVLD